VDIGYLTWSIDILLNICGIPYLSKGVFFRPGGNWIVKKIHCYLQKESLAAFK
jgi:hypothetical protein